MGAGDLFVIETPGGGGFGTPDPASSSRAGMPPGA